MADYDTPPSDSGGSFWNDTGSQLSNLIFDFARAKLASEIRPPAPAPAPLPTRPGVSNVIPFPALSAQAGDVGRQIGEILASPRTWLTVAAVALVVVLVKMRR